MAAVKPRAIGLLLAASLFAAAFLVAARTLRSPDSAPARSWAALGDTAISRMPRGVRRLLADVAWLAAVQHYGERRLAGSATFPEFEALLELALRFDPGIRPAVLSGAFLLAEPSPLGAGKPRAADALLRDWTTRHPGDHEAILIRGLLQHWHLADPEAAAAIFEAGARAEGSPRWLLALAARSWTEAGARETARELWGILAARASDPRARQNAATHLLQLDALDQIDRLAGIAREFGRRYGRPPRTWRELTAAGLLHGVPRDPTGTPFRLNERGVPEISSTSSLAGHPSR